jgi:ABC-type dipeptide/oligopeptide/nickel transport system permease subunit
MDIKETQNHPRRIFKKRSGEHGYWYYILRSFTKSNMAIIGTFIVFVITITAIFTPYIATHDPYEMKFDEFLKAPSREHILGTDNFGRDIFSRIIYGTRISLEVGAISVTLGVLLGVPIGLISGYKGKQVDSLLMRLMDSVLAFPEFLLALTLVAIMGPTTVSVMIALGIVYMPITARVTRSRVLAEKEKEYVVAMHAIGQTPVKILFKNILPNCLPAIIIQSTINFAVAILVEAALSFLGIGTPPPTPSWGRMLHEAKGYIEIAPYTAIFPGIAITLAVLGFNMLGDGLREVLDPRVSRR